MSQITVLNKGNVPMGPFTRAEVASKLQSGEFSLESLAHVEGLTQWTPLRDVLAKVDGASDLSLGATLASMPPATAPAYSYAATMQPPPHLVYAGFWLRFVAILLDGLILGIPMAILGGILGGIIGGIWGFSYGVSHPDGKFGMLDSDGDLNASFLIMEFGIIILSTIVKWLYFSLQESSSAQATLGKRILGLKVITMDGQRIGFGRASGRFFGKFISSLTMLIGYMMAGFTERKQALHDMIAGTLVVRN